MTMYPILLILHSICRWLVLSSLLCTIIVCLRNLEKRLPFSSSINRLRHWTATVAHIQLLLGMALYIQSPVVISKHVASSIVPSAEQFFFKFFHISMMLAAVVLITIGSAKAKRTLEDKKKYQTLIKWFGIGLLLILLAIPWPFSPFGSRPLYRVF